MSVEAWHPPTTPLSLAEHEVHVWRFSLEQPEARRQELLALLSPEERTRAGRFLLERVQQQFIVGRGLLRLTLGRYLGLDPREVRFTHGRNGKPGLPPPLHGLQFNLSHSEARALLGVTRVCELGVDLEQVRTVNDFEGIAQRFFAAGEVGVLFQVPPEQRAQAFFNCWTRKEAYIKASGAGLSHPLDQFEVTLRPGEPAKLLGAVGDPAEAGRWTFHSLTPWPGYVGCVALAAHGWQLRCWDGG